MQGYGICRGHANAAEPEFPAWKGAAPRLAFFFRPGLASGKALHYLLTTQAKDFIKMALARFRKGRSKVFPFFMRTPRAFLPCKARGARVGSPTGRRSPNGEAFHFCKTS